MLVVEEPLVPKLLLLVPLTATNPLEEEGDTLWPVLEPPGGISDVLEPPPGNVLLCGVETVEQVLTLFPYVACYRFIYKNNMHFLKFLFLLKQQMSYKHALYRLETFSAVII